MKLHHERARTTLAPLVRSTLRISALLCVLFVSTAARADDFEKAKNAYIAKDYTEADARFRAMLDPTTGSLKSPELIDEARMFLGASLFALKRPDEADAAWAKILEHNDAYSPDPLTFATPILDAFTDTRTRHKDEINERKRKEALAAAAKKAKEEEEKKKQEAYIKLLQKLASEEKTIDNHSRWLAMVPFGAGQFQNGKKGLGTFFLLSEAALTIATTVTFIVGQVQRGQAFDALNGQDASASNTLLHNQYDQRYATTQYINLSIAGALTLEAIAGVVEAQVNYVPKVELIQKRELPQAWLLPTLSTRPENGAFAGGGLELVGRF